MCHVPLGGTKLPASVRWAIAEMVLGSNPAIHIYASGYAFAHVAFMLGTEEQKHFAKLMVDRHRFELGLSAIQINQLAKATWRRFR